MGEEYTDPEEDGITWQRFAIKNLDTNEVYASYNTFTHCYNGKNKSGYCRSSNTAPFKCPQYEARRRNDEIDAIRRSIFKSNPGISILPPKLVIQEVRDPNYVDEKVAVPELLEVVEGMENIERIYGDEVQDLFSSRDVEGRAWFNSRSQMDENRKRYGPRLKVLKIINEQTGKLYEVDILFPDPKRKPGLGSNAWSYCCIRAIPGDGIYFIVWGGRNARSAEPEEFKIIKYSWQGKQERITAAVLPIKYFTGHQGRVSSYFANLSVDTDRYYFSIYEVNHAHKSGRVMLPEKEYKFQIPFE